ncbi:ABC transporter substrate-binding protein [Streptomyces sp. 6N223]|uniref:ABC transporter substrate-binding protein n=1 Tax=Streptomyces sp. 6N223 TaxID=3457412 RepID=UPI003FCF07D6
MRSRLTVALLAAALALAAPACGGSSSSGDDGTIRIGMITELTGPFQSLGTEARKAADLAVDQINADGGIDGRRLQLIVEDAQGKPEQSVLAFNSFQDQGVTAVLGSSSSLVASGTLPSVDRAEIPYISLTAHDSQVTEDHPYVFAVPALSSDYAEALLRYYQDQGVTRLAVAYDTETQYPLEGHEAMRDLAAEYGIEIVATEETQYDADDFSQIFTHVEDSDAQALVVWMSGAGAVTLVRQYADSGLDIPIAFTGSQASELWLDPAGKAAEGAVVPSAVGVIGDHLPEGEQKRAIDEVSVPFEEEYGYLPPQFAMDGYTGVRVLAAAIEQAGSTDPGDIREALESLTLTTPNGTFRYSAEDHSGLSADYVSVNTVVDGALVPTDWSMRLLERLDRPEGEAP